MVLIYCCAQCVRKNDYQTSDLCEIQQSPVVYRLESSRIGSITWGNHECIGWRGSRVDIIHENEDYEGDTGTDGEPKCNCCSVGMMWFLSLRFCYWASGSM